MTDELIDTDKEKVTVSEDGKVTWSVPNASDTRFRVGSISKARPSRGVPCDRAAAFFRARSL